MKRHNSNTRSDARFMLSLVRVYLLHNAARAPVSSAGMADRLREHGVRLSARSVAQLLRGLCAKDQVEPAGPSTGDRSSIAFRATRKGRAVLAQALGKVEAFYREPGTAPDASVQASATQLSKP